jgi:hypothetical protein
VATFSALAISAPLIFLLKPIDCHWASPVLPLATGDATVTTTTAAQIILTPHNDPYAPPFRACFNQQANRSHQVIFKDFKLKCVLRSRVLLFGVLPTVLSFSHRKTTSSCENSTHFNLEITNDSEKISKSCVF